MGIQYHTAMPSILRKLFDYDFSQERDFHYNGLSMQEVITHLASKKSIALILTVTK